MLLAAAAALAAGVGAGVVAAFGLGGASAGERPQQEVEALRLLRTWDAARAACWERSDPACLTRLYAVGSPAATADVAALQAWTARGLRVVGLRTQVLEVAVVARSFDRWLLDVTDRAVGARAVDAAGAARALPVAQPRRRVVELRRGDGTWQVVRVSPAPAPRAGRR